MEPATNVPHASDSSHANVLILQTVLALHFREQNALHIFPHLA
jgi:hypothetical protein